MNELERAARMALETLMDAQRHNYALKHKDTNDLIAVLCAALGKQNTHAENCWSWGPAHYMCACRELAKAKGWEKG